MPHTHEKLCFTSEVFIVHEDRVLLRKHDKYKVWLAVGGHIEGGEDPAEAALREAKEEVGLDIELIGQPRLPLSSEYKEVLVPEYINRHSVGLGQEHVTFVYCARSKTDQIVQGETEISDETKWFRNEDLDDPAYGLKPAIRAYAKAALEKAKK